MGKRNNLHYHHIRAWLIMLLVGMLALLLIGCTPAPIRQIKKVDGVTIGLEHPARIGLNQEAEATVFVTDSEDRTVSDAIVALELDMPSMPMGQNRPLADPLGGGRYRIRTAYSMVGTWHAIVIVTIDGKEYRAQFEQEVVS